VGPRPDGTIQPEAAERLQAVGKWLETYGTSIYGTRKGPVPPRAWGATTQRGDTVFVHILDWADRSLALPALGGRVARATLLGGGRVELTQTDAGVTLALPAGLRDEPDRVVILEMAAARR